ncbi:MAG: hypothetical protein SH856_02290 [Flavobacteriales bacterium]|nr:hypothetical protein [Flavobacteriales bacterium]
MALLNKFSQSEIFLSQEEAHRVMTFLFGSSELKSSEFTANYIAFAQGLLLAAIEASNAMGVVHALMKAFLYKVPTSFKSIALAVAKFVKNSPRAWWRNKKIKTMKLEDVVIYEAVRNTLKLAHRSEWGARIATGESLNSYIK